jgi:hypothetical protein
LSYTEKPRHSLSSKLHRGNKNKSNSNTKFSSLFNSPANEKYSAIVKIDSVQNANESVLKLLDAFKKAGSREEQIHIYRVADLAGKRADAQLNREDLSEREQLEFAEVSGIYKGFAEGLRKSISPASVS